MHTHTLHLYTEGMYEVQTNVSLAHNTFYGIGGNADELCDITDIQAAPKLWAPVHRQGIPHMVLGAGSNIVCADGGFRGRVFRIKDDTITLEGQEIIAHGGARFSDVITCAAKVGYSDMVNLSGIPGVVGGFVRGNSGAFGTETADVLSWVEVCDATGGVKRFEREECQFGYRSSRFKTDPGLLILRAGFLLQNTGNPETLEQEIQILTTERWKKYPPGRSGGSFFKNPPGDYAGRLLEAAGAKGDRIGNVEISQRHANFFVNLGGGTQADILTLAHKWHTKVRDQFGISLDPEVLIIDEYGRKISLT